MSLTLSLRTAFIRFVHFLSGEVPEDERIHPEFKYHNHDNGFHYNASGMGPVFDTHRLQIF